jgi:hypothetical protein
MAIKIPGVMPFLVAMDFMVKGSSIQFTIGQERSYSSFLFLLRQLFLTLLVETSQLFGIEIHAYCLMDTHYHLLVKTSRANLARAMRHTKPTRSGKFTPQTCYLRCSALGGSLIGCYCTAFSLRWPECRE